MGNICSLGSGGGSNAIVPEGAAPAAAAKLTASEAPPPEAQAAAEVHLAPARAQPKNVLIVGAGMGGLGCAHSLVKSIVDDKVKVTLADAKDYFSIGGTWQFVWTGRTQLEQTKWPLSDAVLPGVTILPKTPLQSLDLQQRTAVLAGDRSVSYDFLVLAPGVVGDGSKIPGLIETSVDVCDIDQAEQAMQELQDFIFKAQVEQNSKPLILVAISAMPYKCPPLPFEIACLIDHELRTAGVRDKVRIAISCPVVFPFAGPPPNPASKVYLPLIEEKGIEWLPEHVLQKVEKDAGRLKVSYGNGAVLEADSIFAIYPQRAPDLFVSAGLTNPKGLIPVDLQTNRLQGQGEAGKDVFVIGDACHCMMPKPNQPHPKAGEFAWQMGQAVAENILAAIDGLPDPLPSKRGGRCVAETGGNTGMDMSTDLTNIIQNPAEGKPIIKCTPGEDNAHEKLTWVNGYIETIFGTKARTFAP